MKAEEVQFIVTVKIEDVDGKPIREGSVLKHIDDDDQGVVMRLVRENEPSFAGKGSLYIRSTSYSTRVTTKYSEWKHIPHEEQTYEQRYYSWLYSNEAVSEHLSDSDEDYEAIAGILALLPTDAVDWSYGPFPDDLSTTLMYLSKYLEKISK